MHEDDVKLVDRNLDRKVNKAFEIDVIDILHNIWKIRIQLFKAVVIGAIVGLIIGFSIPKQYTVSVMLAPESGDSKSSSGLMSMAASFLGGAAVPPSRDALNLSLAPQIIGSTPFLLEMLDARVVSADGKIDSTLYAYMRQERRPWWGYIMQLPFQAIGAVRSLFISDEEGKVSQGGEKKGAIFLSKEKSGRLTSLRHKIRASIDKKSHIISLGATFQDPVITATIADSLVIKLQKYITNYRTSKALEDYNYWRKIHEESKEKYYVAQMNYAKYVDANTNIIYQSTNVERERLQNEASLAYQVYSQVVQQLQLAQAKVQENKPAFSILEPSVVPLVSSTTSKLVLLIEFSFLGVVLTLVWQLFGKKFWKSLDLKRIVDK